MIDARVPGARAFFFQKLEVRRKFHARQHHENPIEKTIQIRVQLSAKHGILLVPLCKVVRDNVKQEIEHMTGMTVQKVDVSIKNLVVDNQKT